jgi:hypothetical protein
MARGEVEYAADIFILRPVDPAKGNKALLYEVNNRGMRLAPGMLIGAIPNPRAPLAACNDPRTAVDLGDAVLLKLGYTLVWSGWDPNASRANGSLSMHKAATPGAVSPALSRADAAGDGARIRSDARHRCLPASVAPHADAENSAHAYHRLRAERPLPCATS